MSNNGPDYKPTPVSMPAQPKTKELPAMTDRALLEDLARSVKDGFRGVNARLDSVETNLDLQGAQGVDLGKRMTALETRVGTMEGRETSSLRPRIEAESKANMEQDAAIAAIIAEQAKAKERDEATQAALAKNTDLTQRGVALAEKASKSPVVLALILAAATYATAWLGHHTP
jgi:hypothetical protein